jgi:predicted nucleotide-binding protein (sugar kinase/HSP70/actin superfamily)
MDARLLESGEMITRKSMAHNTGQCLPVNIIAQEFIEYVRKFDLDPGKAVLWMPESYLSCNLRLYPQFIKNFFNSYGKGFEKSGVYTGLITHLEISLNTCYYAYFAYMLGGLIRKAGCRIRPYEINKGDTDQAITKSLSILERSFSGKDSLDNSINAAISQFEKIPRRLKNRPKVAVFGDFYVRDNDVMNQGLIHAIEESGGEVITTPYTDLVRMNIENSIRRSAYRGNIYEPVFHRLIINILKIFDERYYNRHFRKILGEKAVINPAKLEKHLEDFNISLLHSGESYENILKIFYIIDNHPDIRLFIQTNPAYCCPSLVTEAMNHEIKRLTGIPVVTLTYDGTFENQNDIIKPHLLDHLKSSDV